MTTTASYTHICVFEETPDGFYYCKESDLLQHLQSLDSGQCKFEYIPTDVLYWAIQPSLEDVWGSDVPYHMERVRNCDLQYPITLYNTVVADGVHRIVKAYMLGIDTLACVRITTLPPLQYRLGSRTQPIYDYFSTIQQSF